MNVNLLSNVRFYFAQSVFMNNCHYKAYNRLEKRKKLISQMVICLSGITIILLILQIIGLEYKYNLLISIAAFVGLLLTGSSLMFELINKEDISMLMINHKVVAERYKALRDEYMSLIEEIMSNAYDETILRNKKEKLMKRYSKIGEFAPPTNYDDYKATQNSLGLKGNSNEEFTWSNEEIDKFLPLELKLQEIN